MDASVLRRACGRSCDFFALVTPSNLLVIAPPPSRDGTMTPLGKMPSGRRNFIERGAWRALFRVL